VRWLDNLLYLYTQPFDVVIDPFAGSGSTIDLCKRRFRRYWVSDRKPVIERAHEIREHDITAGLPKLPRWQDVALVYLDPPYWKQAEGEYSNDPEDLGNMPLAESPPAVESAWPCAPVRHR
jgi:DNA modification methylase